MSKTLCPIPWNHLEIQQNGDYKICCICTDLETNWGRLEKDNMPASILNTSLDDARNLNLIKETTVNYGRGYSQVVRNTIPDDYNTLSINYNCL